MRNSLRAIAIAVISLAACSAHAGTIKGKVTAHGMKNGANAVISIARIIGKNFPPPREHAHVDQRKLTFIPHILPILIGTTVDFQNNDNVLHNVYSPDACGDNFNVLGWPNQKPPSHTFTQSKCATKILCGYHSEMLGYIVPVETPYYAVSGTDGSYTISNVPAGHYTVKIWHEKLPGASKEIDVTDSGETTANWELTK